MNITLDLDHVPPISMDSALFQKMVLIHNAVQDGWSVKKRHGSYIFSKPHEGKKEVFDDDYLANFMKTHLDISQILK